MRTIHLFFVALMLFALAACSGSDGVAQAPTMSNSPTIPTAPTALTIKELIKALEDTGKLPKLDRSTNIAGPDINNNGIRDDIDAWIAALPITDSQKKAAEQAAISLQATLLVDLNNKSELNRVGELTNRSVTCLTQVFMPDYQRGFDLGSQIEAITANTKERAKQYIAYNRARSGSVTSSVSGNACNP